MAFAATHPASRLKSAEDSSRRAGATLALAALALPIYFALYCKAYLARREDKYHMAAIDVVMTAIENKTGKDKAVTQSEFVYAMKQHFDDKTVKQV